MFYVGFGKKLITFGFNTVGFMFKLELIIQKYLKKN